MPWRKSSDPDFPQQELNLTLLDQTRENLRRVVKGMPARERVYGEIKARAATRFAPVTVTRFVTEGDRQIVAGSHAVSGAFTREAWERYVKERDPERRAHRVADRDWVLKTAAADDLTLEGSPEQIQKALTTLYKSRVRARVAEVHAGSDRCTTLPASIRPWCT